MKERIGEIVGLWRLVEPVAAGGCADVYLAERVDGVVAHRVAIKIGRGPGRGVLQEAATLRRLSHPSIARWFGNGVTADGCEYVAMEYVRGNPITDYADQRALGIDARMELFVDACSAVAYLHNHLVIHADLKPANVLVNANGTVKVIDFGLARRLERVEAEHVPDSFSAPYASPEQVCGTAQPGCAADVYALGAILYELLCGHEPFSSFLTAAEFERQVAEEIPVPPSAAILQPKIMRAPRGEYVRLEPASIGRMRGCRLSEAIRLIRGDLDRVCLFALRKEPQRRYRCVEDFASDIGMVLQGKRPGIARSGDPLYSVLRATRRRPLEVLGALAILTAALTGYMGYHTFESGRKSEMLERKQVEAAADAAVLEIRELRPKFIKAGLSAAAAALDVTVRKASSGPPRPAWQMWRDYLWPVPHQPSEWTQP